MFSLRMPRSCKYGRNSATRKCLERGFQRNLGAARLTLYLHGPARILVLECQYTLNGAMGAIHKMAATLGDSPTARALRGNFSSQRSLPHLAKHFSLGFLFLLWAKKPRTNKNLSGSIPPSRRNADFCFHKAKISDKGQRELLRPASVCNL